MSSTLKAHLALFSANLIYALNYGIAKDVMGEDYVDPFAFILFRVVGAILLFWAVWLTSKREKIEKKDYLRFVWCGVFGVAANQLMFFEGLHLTNEINASIIMTVNPIMVLIMAAFIVKERLTSQKLMGILLGIAGAVYLILSKEKSAKEASILGDVLIFMNAAAYGLYLIIVMPLMKKYSPFTVAKWSFTLGFIFVLPFGLSQLGDVNWSMPTDIILKIAFVIVFTTFFAYILNISALKHVSPTVVSAYIYLQPLLTSVIALFRETDSITLPKVISAILIFTGVYLVSVKTPLLISPKERN